MDGKNYLYWNPDYPNMTFRMKVLPRPAIAAIQPLFWSMTISLLMLNR